MEIMVYAFKNEYDAFVSCMAEIPELQYRKMSFTHAEEYDEFIKELKSGKHEIVAVLVDGAEGMEGVIASKEMHPGGSVIWLSDDEGFGVQSHRLECTFFGVKPITTRLLTNAMKRYREERIG